jgi:Rrf2 family protein
VLRLSKKMLFAIEAVLDVAYHSGGRPVQSREITRRQDIPRRYLEQALQHLVRQGVLVGVRGPKGGYRLARERRRISVGDVVRAVQAMETRENPIDDKSGSELGRKVVRPLWAELEKAAMERLDGTTIEDLCQRSQDAGIAAEGPSGLDFAI